MLLPVLYNEWLRDGKCLVQGHFDLKSSAIVLMTPLGLPGQGSGAETWVGAELRQGAHETGDITLLSSPSPRGGAKLSRVSARVALAPPRPAAPRPRLGPEIRCPRSRRGLKLWFALGMAAVGEMRFGSGSFRGWRYEVEE